MFDRYYLRGKSIKKEITLIYENEKKIVFYPRIFNLGLFLTIQQVQKVCK